MTHGHSHFDYYCDLFAPCDWLTQSLTDSDWVVTWVWVCPVSLPYIRSLQQKVLGNTIFTCYLNYVVSFGRRAIAHRFKQLSNCRRVCRLRRSGWVCTSRRGRHAGEFSTRLRAPQQKQGLSWKSKKETLSISRSNQRTEYKRSQSFLAHNVMTFYTRGRKSCWRFFFSQFLNIFL